MLGSDFVYPNPAAVRELRTCTNARIVAALRYLVELGTALEPQLCAELVEILDRIDPGAKLGWRAHAHQQLILDALESGDPDRIAERYRSLKDGLSTVASGGVNLITVGRQGEDRFPLYRTAATDDIDHTHKAAYSLELCRERPGDIASFERALLALEEVDRPLSEECRDIIADVFIVDAKRYRAGSTFSTLGGMFVTPLTPAQDWKRYYEHFVHESAHSLLYLLMSQEAVFTDEVDDNEYESPYRSDKRPLSGILHAYFVLWRTIHAFERLLATEGHAEEAATLSTGYNQAGNTGRFVDRFWRTSSELDRSPCLSPFALELIEGCREGVAACQARGLSI